MTKENKNKWGSTLLIEAYDWLLFAILLVPYIWYVLPWVKVNIKGEWKIFLFGFTAGLLAMIIAKILNRFIILPIFRKLFGKKKKIIITKTNHLEFIKEKDDILVLYTEKQEILGRIIFMSRTNKHTFIVSTGLYQITPEMSKEIDDVLSTLNSK